MRIRHEQLRQRQIKNETTENRRCRNLDCGKLLEFTPKNIGALPCRGATPFAVAVA
jgi:hypothetical protein